MMRPECPFEEAEYKIVWEKAIDACLEAYEELLIKLGYQRVADDIRLYQGVPEE